MAVPLAECFFDERKRAWLDADGYEGIDEVRSSISWIHMSAGDCPSDRLATWWGDEIDDLMRAYAKDNRRLTIEKLEPIDLQALAARGLQFVEGQELIEQAHVIKSANELTLLSNSTTGPRASLINKSLIVTDSRRTSGR